MNRLLQTVASAAYYAIQKLAPFAYAQDGLISVHNHDFMVDQDFKRAYDRGVKAGADDYRWHWRIHTGLWAAHSASKLDGDFVECGVNRGFLSSAIMEYIDWNSLNKQFYLLDTFAGIDERLVTTRERDSGFLAKSTDDLQRGFYVSGTEEVTANFSQWKNVHIIQGAVPDTLAQVDSERIAYLHLDMNCAPPEVAAAEYFWERIVTGGFILLDDYAYYGYEEQHRALNEFARNRGARICSLPTGQGLLIKPPA